MSPVIGFTPSGGPRTQRHPRVGGLPRRRRTDGGRVAHGLSGAERRDGRHGHQPPAGRQRGLSGGRLTVRGTCPGTVVLRKDLQIRGATTSTSGAPTLDGELKGTVVTVRPDVSVILQDLIVRRGKEMVTSIGGGGLKVLGTLTLDDTVVSRNVAAFGAGASVLAAGILVMKDASSSRNNSADHSGGGVQVMGGTLEMRLKSSIRSNTANAYGGGILAWNGAIVRLHSSSGIAANRAANGAGVAIQVGQKTTRLILGGASSIRANTATNHGGGIHNFGGTATLKATSVVRRNAAGGGGGVYMGGPAVLRMRDEAIITNNTVKRLGGGIRNLDGTLDGVTCGVGGNVDQNAPHDCSP
jgi:hypothetical protein